MLRGLIKFLFNVDPAPWTEGGGYKLDWLAGPSGDMTLLLLLAIAAALAGIFWLYRREGRSLSLRARLLLVALRMVVLLGVLAMLLEPVLVFVKQEWTPSNLLVLVDVSESMELRDVYDDPVRGERLAATLQLPDAQELSSRSRLQLAQHLLETRLRQGLEVEGDRIVRIMPFTGRLVEGDGSSDASATDKSSSGIGAAIRQAIGAYRGQPLAGVLLISDGQSNAGESPVEAAEYAGAQGVPIVVLAAGTPEGPRNAKISKIEVNPVIFIRDPSPLAVLIESRGMTGGAATVLLERRRAGGTWEELARQPVTLGETGQVQMVHFELQEEQPARLEMRASLVAAGPELTADDNTALAEVRAIRQRIRVLFLAGSSFPEVEFIRNALLRDKGLDVSTWLQSADSNYQHPGSTPIRRLPVAQEELDAYDCVLLYDPDPASWPAAFPQMLSDFVGQAGGGLIYVAGERMTARLFDSAADSTAAWINMLPVVREPGLFRTEVSVRISSREAWKLDITPEGRGDEIFQFSRTPELNEKVLASLPGMYWHFPVTRAKPGATVLARHGDPRMRNQYGPEVLLATQLVGPGRTFFVGFDSTYRWRFLDDQYFDGFWARLIDRAGRGKQLGGRYPYTLSTDRTSYRPGSQVNLTASFVNPDDAGPTLQALVGEADTTDEAPIPLTLTPRPGERGVFETSFTVTRSGPHSIRVWSGEIENGVPGKAPRAARLQIHVELPNLEYERPGQDRATLERIAGASGGAVFDLDQAEQAPAAFRVRKVAHVLEDRQEIWRAPILWLGVLLALFVEWVLRKWYRMV